MLRSVHCLLQVSSDIDARVTLCNYCIMLPNCCLLHLYCLASSICNCYNFL